MKKIAVAFIGILSFVSSTPLSASEEIPHVSSQMTHAAYWIQKLPDPDSVLWTTSQIERHNQKFLRAEPTAVDPAAFPDWIESSFLLTALEKEGASLRAKTLYDRHGRKLKGSDCVAFEEACALRSIPDRIPVRFGLVVKACSLRTFPTLEAAVEEKGKLAFDLLQQTTLRPGEPVVILWESRDKAWDYLASALLRGWVQKEFLGTFDDKKGLGAYEEWPRVIVTERSVPFYERPKGKKLGAWEMGAVLHSASIEEEGDFYQITQPLRDDSGKIFFSPVYVKKKLVTQTFLPFTPRTILAQAFKLYGAPYGWGGLKGGWDCSSFLRDVFLTMGVTLPRNSGPQSRIGKILATFPKDRMEEKKKEILNQVIPTITFVKLDNHIMLYIGKENGRYYVIHATAGYRKPGGFVKKVMRKDRVVSTFRVLVSEMDLGRGGRRGSLLERTVSFNSPFTE